MPYETSRIRNNDPELTRIELGQKGGDYADALEALSRNTFVEEISISCQFHWLGDLTAICDILRSNQRHVIGSPSADVVLSRLRKVEIFWTRDGGASVEDVHQLVLAAARNPNQLTVQLSMCTHKSETVTMALGRESLLSGFHVSYSLADSPIGFESVDEVVRYMQVNENGFSRSLQSFLFVGWDGHPHCFGNLMADAVLSRAANLKRFRVYSNTLGNAFARNRTLEYLRLNASLDEEALPMLVENCLFAAVPSLLQASSQAENRYESWASRA